MTTQPLPPADQALLDSYAEFLNENPTPTEHRDWLTNVLLSKNAQIEAARAEVFTQLEQELGLTLGHGGLTANGDWMFKAEVMKMIQKVKRALTTTK